MMQITTIENGDIEFNTTGALDYLGASSLNSSRHSDFNKLFKNFATLGTNSAPNHDIHIRCDDPSQLCDGYTQAYTSNKDRDSGIARINFCPEYFTSDSLDTVINQNQNEPTDIKFNMDEYSETQTAIFVHELMHIDWVSTAANQQTIKPVVDLSITFTDDKGNSVTEDAYGAVDCKILARYPTTTDDYTIRNADNLALFITSQYVQSKYNNQYPQYPFVSVSGPDKAPTVWNTLFIQNSNGSLVVNSSNPMAAWFVKDPSLLSNSDEDRPMETVSFTSFAPDSAYPSDYISSRNSRLASETQKPDSINTMTRSKTHSSTSSATPSPTQNPGVVCTGSPTKWAPRDPLNSVIPSFCGDAEKQGVQDQNSGSVQRSYLSGNDAVSLSIDWPSGNSWKPNKDDCVKHLSAVMDDCDGNDPNNPMNWKHGGYWLDGVAQYNIVPLNDRGYNQGVCSFRLHEEEYFEGVDWPGEERTHQFYLRDSIKDGKGNVVSTVPSDVGFGDGNPYICNSLYQPLAMTAEAQGSDYIQFSIGSLSWTTKDSDGTGRCNTGDWDSEYSPVGRDMDCFFPC